MIEVNNNIRINFIVVFFIIMLRQLLTESAGHFWQPKIFENVANPDFKISSTYKTLEIYL